MDNNNNLDFEEIIERLENNDPKYDHINLKQIKLDPTKRTKLKNVLEKNTIASCITWMDDDQYEFRKEIEKILSKNFFNYKRYPSDFLHGLLAYHVNNKKKINNKNDIEFETGHFEKKQDKISLIKKYEEILSKWKVEKIFDQKTIMNPFKSGLYSILYRNEEKKHLVLAYKGTSTFKDIGTDLEEVLNKEIGDQLEESYKITKEVVNLANEISYSLSFTGCGLGAWLAEMSIYFSELDFKYSSSRAVCFESPGSREFFNINFESNLDNYKTRIDRTKFDIITYNHDPNFINTCNGHIGKVYHIKQPIRQDTYTDNEFINFIKKFPGIESCRFYFNGLVILLNGAHKIENILKEFDIDTERPKNMVEVLDWPKLINSQTNDTIEKASKAAIQIGTKFIPESDQIPGLDLSTSLVSKFFNKIILKTTIGKIINLLGQILNGNIDYKQLFEFTENQRIYELTNKKEKKLEAEFSIKYKSHYRVYEHDGILNDLLNKQNMIDNLILKLYEIKLENYVKNFLIDQMIKLKSMYVIELQKGANEAKDLIKIVDPNSIYTINDIRDLVYRLMVISNKVVENFLVYKDDRQFKRIKQNFNSIQDNLEFFEQKCDMYVERGNKLAELEEKLNENKLVWIQSMPGMGKTTLAYRFANNYRKQSNQIVRWFLSDSESNFELNILQMALDLGLDDLKDIKSIISNKQLALNKIYQSIKESHKNYLFVLDNFCYFDFIIEKIEYFSFENVKFLILTRDSNVINENKDIFKIKNSINLDYFNDAEIENYFKKLLIDERDECNDEDIIELRKLCKNYFSSVRPYLLNKISIYIKNEKRTKRETRFLKIKEYFEQIQSFIKRDGIINDDPLFVSLKSQKYEWECIQYLAFLDCDQINIEILEISLSYNNQFDIYKIITNLEQLGLISFNIRTRSITIQSDLQLEIKNFLLSNKNKKLSIQEILYDILLALNSLFRKFNEDIFDNIYDDENASIDAYWFKIFNYERNGSKLIEQINNLEKDLSLNNDEEFALELIKLCDLIGSFNIKLNRLNESISYYEQKLELLELIYPNQDNLEKTYTLGTLNNISVQIGNEEKSRKFKKNHNEMISRLKNEPQTEFNDALLNFNILNSDISSVFNELNKGKEKESITQLYQLFGNNPNFFQSNLLKTQALQLFQQSDDSINFDSIYKLNSILNELSLKTGLDSILNELRLKGYSSEIKNRFCEIIDHTDEISKIFKKLSDSMPFFREILIKMHGLIAMLQILVNKNPKALEKLNDTIILIEEIYGKSGNFQKLKVLIYMTIAYMNMNNLTEAFETNENSIKISKSILDKTNNFYLILQFVLKGNIYYLIGKDYNKALEQCLEAKKMIEESNQIDKDFLQYCLFSIANIYTAMENFDEAFKYFDKTLTICNEINEHDNPLKSDIYKNIGFICNIKGDYEQAHFNFERAYNIREQYKMEFIVMNRFKLTESLIYLSLINACKKEKKALDNAKMSHEQVIKQDGLSIYLESLSLFSIGYSYFLCDKNQQEAINYFKKSIYKMRLNLNLLNEYTLFVIVEYLRILIDQSNDDMDKKNSLDACEKLYDSIKENFINLNSNQVLKLLNLISLNYEKLKCYTKALMYAYERHFLLINSSDDSELKKEIIESYRKLSKLFLELKKYDLSLFNLNESYELIKNIYGEFDNIEKVRHLILFGDLFYSWNKDEYAIEKYQQANLMLQKLSYDKISKEFIELITKISQIESKNKNKKSLCKICTCL